MARPIKSGLSYFPLDVKLLRDPKIRKLKIKTGYLGVFTYICILMLVYEHGYYLEVSKDDLADLIYEEIHGPSLRNVDRITEVIDLLATLGLIEAPLMINNVITSKAIQKQWLSSTSRRKEIDKSKYWLLSEYEESRVKKFDDSCVLSVMSEIVNDDNNLVNADNNGVIDSNSTQRKNKNKKEKKRDELDKSDKYDESTFGIPKVHFITKCLIINEYITEFDMNLLKYNELAKDIIEEFGFEVVLEATNYITKYAKRAEPPIDDKFKFFQESIYRNCEMLRKRNNGEGIYGDSFEDFIGALAKKD